MTSAELSRRTGMSLRVVSDILEGKSRNPRSDTIQKLARALGVSPGYLVSGEGETSPGVPIVGFVSAGEEWLAIDVGSYDYLEFSHAEPDHIAVEVRGTSMFPTYRNGEYLVCRRVEGRQLHNAINQDCVVLTADGRSLVKIVRKGTVSGLFTLESFNRDNPDIENIGLAWAAPVEWRKVKRR